ncbi:hypothetical protein POTOM_051625 [Populus tomentosa]|uniref:Uncharacterized protein n=1 Tax=Populus tomentosa TaxID=118781 RepID=A0A8X8C9W6_POPTO|nr:hypothetical protein POTOM_051625 [Populus tomentosa]
MSSNTSASPISKRLEGKVALITGGASGIGECTARLFVQHGSKFLIGDVQDDLGRALCQEYGSEEIISYVHCNVTVDSDVQNAVDTAVSRYGKLDIMFNNACDMAILSAKAVNVCGTKFRCLQQASSELLCHHVEKMNSDSSVTLATKRLEGKVALITGGASGIGECSARLFVQHGAKVLIADIQDDLGEALCKSLGSQESISYIHCDVTCDSDVKNAVDMAVSKYGKLDIMFNNAGIISRNLATPMVIESMGIEKRKFEEFLSSSSAILKESLLEPEDFANAEIYLPSDESKYTSGINLVIDGG